MWQRAASFAARAHHRQLRKDGVTPYIAHPFRVAMTVRDVFGCADPVALAVAILHDTIEDTTVDYDDLLAAFGEPVAECVAALTKNKALREDVREEEYDARLAAAPWQARLVKLADTYDNLADTVEEPGGLRKKQLGRMVPRCERAIALARPDGDAHGDIRRGIECVAERLGSAKKELGVG